MTQHNALQSCMKPDIYEMPVECLLAHIKQNAQSNCFKPRTNCTNSDTMKGKLKAAAPE